MWERGYIGIYLLIIVNLITTILSDETCTKPPVLNDLTIREPSFYSDYWTTGDGLLLNDRELNTAWYRAVFNGRQYLMSDSEAGLVTTKCNTLYPIYLKDKHPSLDELSDTPITRAACVLDFDESCSFEVDVMIRKCDKEIQYHLESTLIYSAYCFAAGEVVYDTEVAAPTNVNLGTIKAVPELRFKRSPARNKRFDFNYSPYIQFRCIFSNSSDHFYNVQWKVAGKTIASLGPSKSMDDLCLHEDNFRDVPLGYKVQCSVTVSAAMFGQQTEPKYSDDFYAGVKIYNRTMYLSKGRSEKVSMSSTLPIGCQHTDKFYLVCKGELRIMNANPHECLEEGINNIVTTDYSKCTEYIKTIHKDEAWDPDTRFHFTIVTSDMDYEDRTNFDLKLKFSGNMQHEFWKDKVLPDVRVVVGDKDEYKEKVCYTNNDPHIRTADKYYYPQQLEGDFILYYNVKYNIEVQEKTKSCGFRGTCACGVSIRAGKDVFIINRCGGVNFLGFSQCDDGGILQVIETKSDEYTVYTPIGTKITIRIYSGLINIQIKMAPKDLKNVYGLCGKFDGDMTNDLVHSDMRTESLTTSSYTEHIDFANSWRVPENRIYSRKKRSLKSWQNLNGLYCVCKQDKAGISGEALCSSTQYLDCPMKKSITNTKCHIHKYRKKRSLAAHEKEMDRLFALMEADNEHNVKKRQTHESISEEEAKKTCSKMVSESLAFTSYKNMTASESPDIVINQCVFDLLATQDRAFAEVHKDSVNTIVKGMMNEVPTYVETNKQEVQVFLKSSCFSNCSDRGNCSEDGECICDQYYHGAICNIDERIPPVVMDIEGGGVCDIGEGDECRCFYLRGDNFLKSMKCKFATSEISITGEITNLTMETVEGGAEDVFTGVCCIPEEKIYSDDMFLREHDISISNDGVHYGENNTMYVFDSACQKLDSLSTGGRPSFTLKSGFCFIRQACIEDTYAVVSNNDTCLSCNTSVSVNDWTETSMEICIPTTTTSTTMTTKACITTTESVPENTTGLMANMSTDTNEVNGTTEPTLNLTTQVELTTEPALNLTTQVELTTEPTLNLTTQVEVTTESTKNLTTQTQQSESTSKKPSPRKRCRIKAFLRLKARYEKLSLRNKKRKLKIQRQTKRINRLKMVLERFQNKGKRSTEQTPTKTTMKTTKIHSTMTVGKTTNDQLPKGNEGINHLESNGNVTTEQTTIQQT